MNENEYWDEVIKPRTRWNDLSLGEIWKYRDLVLLMVRRDFVSVYKQTVLGPLWFFIQPILTALAFTVVFTKIASISTDQTPPFLFYLSGITLWTYFADCLNKTSSTFVANASVFGKVYFPRLVVPLSVLISNLIKLGIQMILFLSVWGYYLVNSNQLQPHYLYLWILPILVLIMAGLGLGFGIFISSVTTKYRDFTFLVGFGVQLLMYGSPIIYPLDTLAEDKRWIILINPVSSVIETFKYVFLGRGMFHLTGLVYSFAFMLIMLFISIIIFSRVEKSFMDTV